MLNDADMYRCMKVVKSLRSVAQVHAENGDLIAEVRGQLVYCGELLFSSLHN